MPPLVDQNSQSEVVSTTVSTTCGLLYAISKAMEEEVAQGDIAAETADAFAPLSVSIFDGNAAPSITISSYLERLSAYMHCSIECFLLALPLLARVLRAATDTSSLNPSDPGGPGHFHLHSRSAHRLLGTAVVIAAKFHEEAPRKNAYYATVVGVPLHELNKLEVAFLNALSFNVYVPLIELERWRDRVAWTVVDSALQLGAWELPVSPLTSSSPSGGWAGFDCLDLGPDDGDAQPTAGVAVAGVAGDLHPRSISASSLPPLTTTSTIPAAGDRAALLAAMDAFATTAAGG